MYNLANNYWLGKGIEENHAKALELYKESADLGLPEAQCTLGTIYKEGIIVEKDYKKAREYYEKAVEQGFAPAQVNLGLMYKLPKHYKMFKENGCYYCDEESYKKAVELFRLAANQGDARGQNNLAIMLYIGRGVDANRKDAIALFQKALKQDYAPAIHNLGNTCGPMDMVEVRKYNEMEKKARTEGKLENITQYYANTETWYE